MNPTIHLLKTYFMNISIIAVILSVTIVDAVDGYVMNRSLPIKNNRRVVRIANGEQFDEAYYPYIVGLKIEIFDEQTYYCTGTLVSPSFVLTAAHCTDGANYIEVIKIFDHRHSTSSRYTINVNRIQFINKTIGYNRSRVNSKLVKLCVGLDRINES